MKRCFLVFVYVFCSFYVFSQSYPTGVCGILFGTSYEAAEKELSKKYGEKSYGSSINSIEYYDIKVGNIFFEFASFNFQNAYGSRLFNEADFYNHFETKKDAEEFLEYVSDTLFEKYNDMEKLYDKNDMPLYRCGLNETEGKFRILVTLSKGKSKGGDTYYYVHMYYMGRDYVNPMDDL